MQDFLKLSLQEYDDMKTGTKLIKSFIITKCRRLKPDKLKMTNAFSTVIVIEHNYSLRIFWQKKKTLENMWSITKIRQTQVAEESEGCLDQVAEFLRLTFPLAHCDPIWHLL